jgi:hypothetical protein
VNFRAISIGDFCHNRDSLAPAVFHCAAQVAQEDAPWTKRYPLFGSGIARSVAVRGRGTQELVRLGQKRCDTAAFADARTLRPSWRFGCAARDKVRALEMAHNDLTRTVPADTGWIIILAQSGATILPRGCSPPAFL